MDAGREIYIYIYIYIFLQVRGGWESMWGGSVL